MQKISAISDNSAVIITSTRDAKFRQRNRAKKKKRYQQVNTQISPTKSEDNETSPLASRFNEAPPNSQFEVKLSELNLDKDFKGGNGTKTHSPKEKPLPSSGAVHSQASGRPSMMENSSNPASDTNPSANADKKYLNQRDELTVF